MKNKLHGDTAKFWKYRGAVLDNSVPNIKRKYFQWRMNQITRYYNAVIPNQAMIYGVPITPHGLIGIFISKKAVIGKNVTIHQNVTIGSNEKKDSKNYGAPAIGNNVFIGANAVIIGGITIGDGCWIGAGCAVSKSIPPHSTVVSAGVRILNTRDSG